MGENRHDRSRLILPAGALKKLEKSSVLVAGLGGVGSWAAEALARAGVGRLVLVDFDRITPSNLNRQLYALESTLGEAKCDVARSRLLQVHSGIRVDCYIERLEAGSTGDFLDRAAPLDYLLDAIDDISAKADLIVAAKKRGIPVISSMGTGNRLDPSCLFITDLYQTQGDPLARILRQRLRKLNVDELKVVCSSETPIRHDGGPGMIGSSPFVPPSAGFLLASQVIRDLVSDPGPAGGSG